MGRLHAAPVPLELAILLTAALAGLLAGFASLALVQRIVRDRAGCAWSRAFVIAALVTSSFGVYLGRFLRWNSWDVIASPRPLLADVAERFADPLAHPVTWGGAAGFSLFLLLRSPSRRDGARRPLQAQLLKADSGARAPVSGIQRRFCVRNATRSSICRFDRIRP